MKQRKTGATVKFYALTWPGTKYAYIGQAEHPEARFTRHIEKLQSGKATQYMQNVFNKYGMPVLTVLDKEYVMQSPLDIGAHDIEQAYYAEYDAAGYKLVNGIMPRKSYLQPRFGEALEQHSQRLSAGIKYAYDTKPELHDKLRTKQAEICARPETHDVRSRNTKCRMAPGQQFRDIALTAMHSNEQVRKQRAAEAQSRTEVKAKVQAALHSDVANEHRRTALQSDDVRAKISASTKAKMADSEVRQRMLDGINRPEVVAARKSAYVATVQRRHDWLAKYQTKDAYKYINDNDARFKSWMHFIIQPDDNVIVFVWDTRKVLFQCNKQDLPAGYIKVKDSYLPLVFEDQ